MIKRLLFSLILPSIFQLSISAQNPFPENGEVFRDDVVPRIDIIFPEDSLNTLLAPGNEESNYHFHATFIFNNENITDTLENIGFRLRGNTSRYADKKSFKISFNTYESGRKFYGLEKLNINGEHNDPTVARSKICWDLARQFKIPAPRANHIQLYINGEYFGLYINVEHIDEEFIETRFGNKSGNLFKCLYPADLVYKGTNPNLYKEVFWGRRAYALKTNEAADNYTDFANFVDILNNIPIADLPCELEKVFNVNTYLKTIIFDVLTGNWDGPLYNKNNFYLYHNIKTDKFEYIPFDLDNSLGIDWLNKDWGTRDMYSWGHNGEERPLYSRILEVEAYRDRFSYYMQQFLQNSYSQTELFPYINDLRDLIDEYAEDDPFRPLDYGFSYQNFLDAFDELIPFASQTADYGIKDFIETRRQFSTTQLALNNIAPIILGVENNHPTEEEEMMVSASIEEVGNSFTVEFCYQIDNQVPTVCLEMFDDGLNNDADANDGVFGIILPALGVAATLNYFIKVTDDLGLENIAPNCGFHELFVESSEVTLALNEFMASNNSTIADEFGEFDDWVEIYNYGTTTQFLGNRFLSDDPDFPNKWTMPTVTIAPGEFLLLWVDNDNNQGNHHANFKLNATGEFIGIFDSQVNNFAPIDGIQFGAQNTDVSFGRLPNGIGEYQQLNPTPAASNMPVSTENIADENQINFTLFPNPFENLIQLKFNNLQNHQPKISITDVTGKTIFEMEKTVGSISETINTTSFPKGLYFIVLEQSGEIISTKKIVKQ